MLPLVSLALPVVTSLFAATIPIIFASLGSLLAFALSRSAQLPRYIRVLVLLYQDSAPDSQTRKYVTSALLVLGGILSFMAHSFVPFIGAPILGAVTTPVALLFALVVVLATLDLVANLNESFLANLKSVHCDDVLGIQDDILAVKAQLGPKWAELTKKIQKVFDELAPKIQEQGEEFAKEINK